MGKPKKKYVPPTTRLTPEFRAQGFLFRGGYGEVRLLDWDHRGLWVAARAGLLLWDAHEGDLLSCFWTPIAGVARDQQGRLYTASRQIDRWSSDFQSEQSWSPHSAPIRDLAVSPDGQQLVSLGEDASLLVCDAAGTELRRLSVARGTQRLRVDWSQRKAWTDGAEGAEEWDLDSGIRLSEGSRMPALELAEGGWTTDQQGRALWQNQAVEFLREALVDWCKDPGGEWLALASQHELVVVNRADGQLLRKWDDFGEFSLCAAASPEGRWIVSGDAAGQLSQRRLDNGSLKHRWVGHSAAVTSICFGQGVLLSAAADGTIRSWNWQGCDPLHNLDGHVGAVRHLLVEGAWLFSAGSDGKILVWDYLGGEVTATLRGYDSPVQQLQLLQRGEVLLALYEDGNWITWDVSGYG